MARTLKVITEVERANSKEIVKPEELIDIRPARGKTLGLAARKYFNLMLKEAGGRVGDPVRHRILKRTLRQGHKSNDHLSSILEELAGTTVDIKTESSRGKTALALSQLVKIIVETDDGDGAWVEFEFDPDLRKVIVDSEIYASLQAQAVLAMRSKYSLVLYELGSKLSNRKVPIATFGIEDFRAMVGVPDGALLEFAQFRRRVIDAAKAEIDQLADFTMSYIVKREGKTPVALELQFWKKSGDAADKSRAELSRHSVGRRVRRASKAEKLSISAPPPAPASPRSSGIPGVPIEDLERVMKTVKRPQDLIAQALDAEKQKPGAGRIVIQQALED